jgi:hypothetical protein
MYGSALLSEYDFSKFNHIIDIGGGYGELLYKISDAYPDIHAVLFEKKEVIHDIVLDDKYNGKIRLVSGDFFQSVPENGDLYILKQVIHDWDDEKAIRILKTVKRSMRADSKLLLVEAMMEEDERNWYKLYLDILLLTMFDGKERSRDQFEHILHQSGLKINTIIHTRSPISLIDCGMIDTELEEGAR